MDILGLKTSSLHILTVKMITCYDTKLYGFTQPFKNQSV